MGSGLFLGECVCVCVLHVPGCSKHRNIFTKNARYLLDFESQIRLSFIRYRTLNKLLCLRPPPCKLSRLSQMLFAIISTNDYLQYFCSVLADSVLVDGDDRLFFFKDCNFRSITSSCANLPSRLLPMAMASNSASPSPCS